MEPHVQRLAALRFKPEVIWRYLRTLIFEIAASPTKLPRQLFSNSRLSHQGRRFPRVILMIF
jgi:hypothetical protein